jgi:hypothetical protein
MWGIHSRSNELAAPLLAAVSCLALPAAAGAQGPSHSTGLSVAGLELSVSIEFEQAVGVTPQNLGLTARLLGPLELLGQLTGGVSLPSALPVLVSIEPPASGGLSFTGVATVEIHTPELLFSPRLLLFKSTGGGPWVDITQGVGTGSHRVRGSSGGFSRFLILRDLRPVSTIVNGKFNRLGNLLSEHEGSIPAPIADQLAAHLLAAETAWSAGDAREAVDELDAFAAAVEAASGTDIPDVWRSSGDLTNVAGELRSAAGTLRFSIDTAGG